MTVAGLLSGTHDISVPAVCARTAAAVSLVLGMVLLGLLPSLLDAADYVGVLGGTGAVAALTGGLLLWRRADLVAWAVGSLAAGMVLVVVLLELVLGLPGTQRAPLPGLAESGAVLALSATVLAVSTFAALGRVHRGQEGAPRPPYAL